MLIVALVASAYGFCQVKIKTDDGSFVGFPSYWNIVAYYLYCWPMNGTLAAGLIGLLAFLTFIPTRYAYPSQPGRLNRVLLILSVPWCLLLLFDTSQTWIGRETPRWEVVVSAVYPALYMGAAWLQSLWLLRR